MQSWCSSVVGMALAAKLGVVIHHNGPPAKCVGQPHRRCVSFWDAVKRYHVETKGWSDVAYSFGICSHGMRFTGRGWDKNQFANGSDVVGPDDGRDSEWYTVLVFLGGDETPTEEMVEATKALIAEGRASGRCGRRVLPHNAFKVKACPGPEFTAYAQAWDRQPLNIATSKEDEIMFTKDEAALHVIACFEDITGEWPSPEQHDEWTKHLTFDGRNYFRLITLLVRQEREEAE